MTVKQDEYISFKGIVTNSIPISGQKGNGNKSTLLTFYVYSHVYVLFHVSFVASMLALLLGESTI